MPYVMLINHVTKSNYMAQKPSSFYIFFLMQRIDYILLKKETLMKFFTETNVKFKCGVCSFATKEKVNLKRHELVHRSERKFKSPEESSQKTPVTTLR